MSGLSMGLGIGLGHNKPVLGKIKPNTDSISVSNSLSKKDSYDSVNEEKGIESYNSIETSSTASTDTKVEKSYWNF